MEKILSYIKLKGDAATVTLIQPGNEDDIWSVNSAGQDEVENSGQKEKSPEFDVIGTALNDI
ncbi:hypothetical protein QNH39_15935 [Neobacillus novalis]|uniref:Uncharacterized protein n=1 Tax=Neobacillus novalis TaxID=220687 RepID=A0AA95ML87_9BACI|nr:hypothetical protein [Neobacillus novalis]WHY84158.1 hypothetical protein QNH39_15935 [Neobacillus novalis]